MGRTLPIDCLKCGGVIDWGDFGPDSNDGSVDTTCVCVSESFNDSMICTCFIGHPDDPLYADTEGCETCFRNWVAWQRYDRQVRDTEGSTE